MSDPTPPDSQATPAPHLKRLRRPASGKCGFELIAWVVRPEHIHLMMRPLPRVVWVPIAAGLKTSVGKRILNRWQRARAPIRSRRQDARSDLHFWHPGGGFDRNVRDDGELEKEIRYIHNNPVERGLVRKPDGLGVVQPTLLGDPARAVSGGLRVEPMARSARWLGGVVDG